VLKKNGKEVAFLGAKALYKKEDLMQYITYCVSKGVSYFMYRNNNLIPYIPYIRKNIGNTNLIKELKKDMPARM
jgi:hypothetical protein